MDDQVSSEVIPHSLPAALMLLVLGLLGVVGRDGNSTTPYRDSAGVTTIGLDTTRADGRPVQVADRIEPILALVAVRDDVTAKEREMRVCLGTVPLYQRKWD